ncbi:MAG TPA: PEP-CTERM sorting domain-containing protein [Gammaproteobacteria bacterium]|nr:PEP-CTERM sorting domain-containing protein [Gammaproteobacteria bacterium]
MTSRNKLLAGNALLIALFSSAASHAAPILDLSANVIESTSADGTVFHDSAPLFGVTADPLQSAELLHLSDVGVNASGRSTTISQAFASSLAESDGNGAVGVSQLLFGPGGESGQDAVRQMVAQSLWTHTFLYSGPAANDILHLDIPKIQVGLLDVPPRRTGISTSETAEAKVQVDSVVMHPDGSGTQGTFQFGLREFERQFPSGQDLLNVADVEILLQMNPPFATAPTFNGDDFNPSYALDPLALDLDLGVILPGDTVSWVYTLTALGTTRGFERGYFAFVGDPFGGQATSGNLTETFAPVTVPEVTVPEPGTSSLMLLGVAGLLPRRRHTLKRGYRQRKSLSVIGKQIESHAASTPAC